MKIIYKKEDSINLLQCVDNPFISFEDCLKKDIPFGCPYFIVEDSAIPNVQFMEAWEADFSNPDGYGIGPQRWFIQRAEEEISKGINVQQNREIIKNLKKEILELEGVRV